MCYDDLVSALAIETLADEKKYDCLRTSESADRTVVKPMYKLA